MKIKTVAVIGLGAVGAVVGDQLVKVLEKNLYVVVDADRKARYIKNGIFINNGACSFNYVTPEELPVVDLIIIATKNLQIDAAIANIKNGVGENTMILSLLNGIQSEKDIEAAYGEAKTLYGFIIDLQSINLSGKITCAGKGKIVFGEKNNVRTERIQAIEKLFTESGIKYLVPENIQFEMWKKFLINTVFNSLGGITRSTYGGFNFDVMKSLVRKVGYEVVEVANAEGIPLPKELLEDDIKMTCGYDPLGKCSLLQDVEAGRNTENKWFCGTICKLGKEHGIATPYCEFLGELLEGTELVRTIRK